MSPPYLCFTKELMFLMFSNCGEVRNCWRKCNFKMLEKTLESSLDSKEIKPVNPTGNQSWIFIVKTDAEALVLWPPDAKNQLIGKVPDAGKDCRGWNGYIASPTQWTWIWANSKRQQRTGKPVVLQSTGLQRAGHDLGPKQQQKFVTMTFFSSNIRRSALSPSLSCCEEDVK